MRFILILAFLSTGLLFGQDNFNLTLVSQVEIDETGNDVWGYVDQNGVEYAIMGGQTATYIYSLKDPSMPLKVAEVPGSSSTWRDMKSWNDHIYVTTDSGNDGLLIIDMSAVPDSVTHTFWKPVLEVGMDSTTLRTCHNLYIDENGFCYLAGCNLGARGIIILDITTDPKNPIMLSAADITYSHDVYVKNDRMYASELNAGRFGIYDVSDKTNPVYLAGQITGFDFTHNAWLSDDETTLFTTDERSNAFVEAWDISDLNDIRFLDKFQPVETRGLGVIPHNTHYHDGYLVTSWYTDGVVITDATKPDNLVKVGAYDTWAGPDGGFNGCWGAYPYLPSGLVLASDRATGLYVLQPNYVRASYLEGRVTSAIDGLPINGVQVYIEASQPNLKVSDATGEYRTGIAESGSYTVIFRHPDYEILTIDTTLGSGEVTILDVQLNEIQKFRLAGSIVSKEDGSAIANARVKFYNVDREYEVQTDASGAFNTEVVDEMFDIVAGAWGYRHTVRTNYMPDPNEEIIIELEQGYMDDFVLDLGWTVAGDAPRGIWERGIPNPTSFSGINVNVNADIEGDIGLECYMTGNAQGGVGDDDVDNGQTILISPNMDLSGMSNPVIQYYAWFFNGGGSGAPNDTLKIEISNGVETAIVDQYTVSTDGWTDLMQIQVSEFIQVSDAMVLSITTGDEAGSGHLVEAGFDGFDVIEGEVSSNENVVSETRFKVYPNPFERVLTIEDSPAEIQSLSLYNIVGQEVYSSQGQRSRHVIDIPLQEGIYILRIVTSEGKEVTQKVIRQ